LDFSPLDTRIGIFYCPGFARLIPNLNEPSRVSCLLASKTRDAGAANNTGGGASADVVIPDAAQRRSGIQM